MDMEQCGNEEQSYTCDKSGGREALSSHQMDKAK